MRRKGLLAKIFDNLIEGLEGIQNSLPEVSGYIFESEDEDVVISEGGKIDSEEVEVALTGLVSTISKALDLTVEPASLSDLLEEILSPDDDAVSVAVNLEDAVNGYFGELFGENLELAEIYFGELIKLLKETREKWTGQKG